LAPGLYRMASTDAGPVVIIKNMAEYKAALDKATGLSVAYHTAAWCGPCKMIWPHVLELASNNPKTLFLKIDVDEVSDVSAANGISAMPTFLFLKNGQKVDQLVGANPRMLRDLVAKHTASE